MMCVVNDIRKVKLKVNKLLPGVVTDACDLSTLGAGAGEWPQVKGSLGYMDDLSGFFFRLFFFKMTHIAEDHHHQSLVIARMFLKQTL